MSRRLSEVWNTLELTMSFWKGSSSSCYQSSFEGPSSNDWLLLLSRSLFHYLSEESVSPKKPQGEFPVPLHQNRQGGGGGGESGRRGAMECPSRRIVFGYRTTEKGGREEWLCWEVESFWKGDETEEQLLQGKFGRWRSVSTQSCVDWSGEADRLSQKEKGLEV